MNIGLRNAFELAPVEVKIKNIRYRETYACIKAAFIVSTDLCNTSFVGRDKRCVDC